MRLYKKKVAVLILNWNGHSLLKKYLPSLLKYTDKSLADIVVIDNASTDESISYLEREYPEETVRVQLNKNYGFAEGYNRGINKLLLTQSYDYLLLLNNDVRVSPNWLQPLVQFLDKHPNVASVQPSILSDRDPSKYEYAGALGGMMDYLGYPFCRGRIFHVLEEDKGQYGMLPLSCFWTSGACMLCRTYLYERVGGFDDSFFAHQEEIDLSWRWHILGYDTYVVPSSVVYHYGGASLDESNPHKCYLNFRNNLRMLSKNLPHTAVRPLTFIFRFFLDLLASLVFLLKASPRHTLSVIRAWLDYLKSDIKVETDMEGTKKSYRRLYQHSILIRYYLFREKTFSKLKL